MWNIQSNIYEVCHHTACVTANFQLKYLILKANAIEASCSWSRNNVASFHHGVLCWESLVRPLFDSAISVWLAVSDPWASKIHWSSANICQAQRPASLIICPPHLNKPIHECTVCCWHDGKCLLSSQCLSTVKAPNISIAYSLSLF